MLIKQYLTIFFLLVQLKLRVHGVIRCSAWPQLLPDVPAARQSLCGLAVDEASCRAFQISTKIFIQWNKRPSPPAHMCSPCKAAGSLRELPTFQQAPCCRQLFGLL